MLALERRNLILEKLQEEKRVVVSELSQLYNVSEETIRRDLDKLEKEGLATKSYGGAVINEDVGIDLPFNIRKNQNVQGKQKMAEIAASMVNDGDHIFLDASTTAVFVAKALKEKERLTVVTNSMEILLELSDVSGWNIISTGGVMKEGYLAFLGARTEEVIRSYYVDKVIFSCKALNEDMGIMESKEAFGTTKKAMINSGKMRILVSHICHGTRAGGLLDQIRLRECGEHDDRGDVLIADHAGRGDAVGTRHLHIHAHHVRTVLTGQFDGLLTIGRFTDDLVAIVFKHGDQIHAIHRFIFGHHNGTLMRFALLG